MYQTYTSQQFSSLPTNRNIRADRIAVSLYNRMVWMGKVNAWVRRLIGHRSELLNLQEVANQTAITSRNYLGQQSILVNQIVGSESRSHDFDIDFNVTQENTRDRWVRIAIARQKHIGLPPVELIKLGDKYYVRDGHHRISVARAFGEAYIDAEVTEWNSAADPQSCMQFDHVPG